MFKNITISASALLAASAFAAPASAGELPANGAAASSSPYAAVHGGGAIEQMHHKRKHRGKGKHHARGYAQPAGYGYPAYQPRDGYGEQVGRDTRVWRGEDDRYYCRRNDGTTGLLIGGAAGALLGRELAGNGDRTLGAILGAAGGALLGREVEKRVVRCR